ncbi:M56 family metallopeptidase [Polyangium spumosum]|uniref:Peptidase M56 domain-containing protein n=1 Tax=Polyangium spumosum TaxID=889282 RepID=A0A6N7PQ69_9BACT|nr:M56 family metallopeptidase [Polyangium spumosum]MRG93767.1 hypothetical protein [Polyangium spumosum]
MSTLVGWMVTYLIHSTVLLGGAWLVDRLSRNRPDWQELAWRVALVGGLVTATVQTAASLRPVGGTFSLAEPPPSTERAIQREMPRATEIVVTTDMGPAVIVTTTNAAAIVPIEAKSASAAKTTRESFLSWSKVFVAGWAFGAILLLGALGRSFLFLRKRLEGRRRLEGGPLGDMLATLAAREPICMRAPLLSASDKVHVPMALGIRRPEICVPERVTKELGPDAQESVLAHELGHVARRDPLLRLVTSVFCRVFFFQPLNWLAAHRLSACAELLADDWAARRTARPLDLAECLTKVARWVHRPMSGLPVPTMAAGTSELRQRVERLVRGEGLTTEPRRPLWAAPIVAFVLTALTLLAPSACGVAEAKGLPPAQSPQAKKGAAPGPRPLLVVTSDEDEDDEDETPVCEGPKHKRKAKDHARPEKRHGDEHARRHHGRHVDQDEDEDEDEDEDDEDEEITRGPGRIRVHVPRIGAPNVEVDVDPQIEIDMRQLQRSIPTPEEIDAELERALEQARKHAPDEATRKRVEKEIKRARKQARKDLEAAREELQAAREEMQERLRELREQMPEIRRRAMENAREAAEEAEKESRKAHKKHKRAHKKHHDGVPPLPPAPPMPPGPHGMPMPPMPPMPPGPHHAPMPPAPPAPPAPPPPPAD